MPSAAEAKKIEKAMEEAKARLDELEVEAEAGRVRAETQFSEALSRNAEERRLWEETRAQLTDTFRALAGEALDGPGSLATARRLLGASLTAALDGRELASRKVARAVRSVRAGTEEH